MTSEWKVRLLITEQFQVALIFIVFFPWKPMEASSNKNSLVTNSLFLHSDVIQAVVPGFENPLLL